MSEPRRAALICVVPNPSIDKTAVVDHVSVGEIHRPAEVVMVPGGKTLNVARAARALGVPVTTILLLAGHAGRWIEDELRHRRIDREIVWTSGETRTCLSILDAATGELTEIYESGPAVSEVVWARFARRITAAVRAERLPPLVAISGSLPPGLPSSAAGTVVRAARDAGGRVLLDAAGPTLEAGVAAGPALVKVNEAEAAGIVRGAVDTESDALRAAKELVRRGATSAVVTRGALGAVAWDSVAAWAVDAPSTGGHHTVGTGDAFLAGLAAGRRRDEALDACLRRAAAAAASSTLVVGAGNLDRRAVSSFAAATAVRRLD